MKFSKRLAKNKNGKKVGKIPFTKVSLKKAFLERVKKLKTFKINYFAYLFYKIGCFIIVIFFAFGIFIISEK